MPSQHLKRVLEKHPDAVMLTRDQYDALLRDAGRVKPVDEKAPTPQGAVVETMRLRGKMLPGASSVLIEGTVGIHALAEGWSAADLRMPFAQMSHLASGAGVLAAEIAKSDEAKKSEAKGGGPQLLTLLVRGPRRHEVAFSAILPITSGGSLSERRLGFAKTLVPAVLELDLPAGAVVVSGPPHEQKGSVFRLALNTGAADRIEWREPLAGASATPSFLQDFAGTGRISEAEMTVRGRLRASSSATDKPFQELAFDVLPASATVVAVRSAGVVSWEQGKDGLVVRLREPVASVDLEIEARGLLSLPEKESLWAEVPALRLRGAQRSGFGLVLATDEGVDMLQTRGGTRDSAHSLQWDAASGRAEVLLRRATPHVVVDADAEIRVERDTVRVSRTLNVTTDRPLSELRVTLPEGETLMSVTELPRPDAKDKPEPMEWKQAGTVIELKWPSGLSIARSSKIAIVSQQRIQAAADAAAPVQTVTVRSIAAPDAGKLAGYIALDHDSAWRATVTQARGLEDRDARLTPVRGKAAWFTLREHELVFELRRRESVIDAEITAFALPRAKTIEIEGQIVLDISGAPARTLAVTLTPAAARLLRFVSPLVGEQQLDAAKGEWKITFAREIAGRQVLRFRLSLPADAAAADAQGAAGSAAFTATLPRFEIASARRFRGSWVVEANTDTQLTFQTQSLQPVDVMRVPSVEGYTPRHRLVAAYAYGPGAHALTLSATRHASSELASLVVTRLDLTSVLDPDGSSRHEAAINLRHTGEQFVQVRLPQSAQLLSVLVEHGAVKPVRGEGGSIAIPLPGDSANRDNVRATVLFDLPGQPWAASGKRDLAPVEVLGSVPVLATDWRVHAPEGFSYAKVKTGMDQDGQEKPEGLLSVIGEAASALQAPTFMAGGSAPTDGGAVTRRELAPTAQTKSEYFDTARDHTRARMANEVSQAWKGKPLPRIAEREIARRSGRIEDVRLAVEQGDSLLALGNFSEALAEYKSALDSLPVAPTTEDWRNLASSKYADATVVLARKLASSGQYDDARRELAAALAVSPGNAQVLSLQQQLSDPDRYPGALAPPGARQADAAALKQKLDSIILPSVSFQGATVEEALEFLRLKTRDLDTMERDPSARGVNIVMAAPDQAISNQITLDLKDVPLGEALRYVTELAGMKYKIEPHAVVIVPISDLGSEMYTEFYKVPADFLSRLRREGSSADDGALRRRSARTAIEEAGIPIPEGASVTFNASTNQLIVRNTRPNLDAMEALVAQLGVPEEVVASSKTGLVPLELDLPKAGVMMRFHGAQAPEVLELRYVSWERQMAVASGCMALGGLLFAVCGRRRPWLRSLLAVLVLGVAVQLFAEGWLPQANAALFGWLGALVLTILWRVLASIVRRTSGESLEMRKELAA